VVNTLLRGLVVCAAATGADPGFAVTADADAEARLRAGWMGFAIATGADPGTGTGAVVRAGFLTCVTTGADAGFAVVTDADAGVRAGWVGFAVATVAGFEPFATTVALLDFAWASFEGTGIAGFTATVAAADLALATFAGFEPFAATGAAAGFAFVLVARPRSCALGGAASRAPG
jgi:hypothetical protein